MSDPIIDELLNPRGDLFAAGQNWKSVPNPTGWTWTIPFSAQRRRRTFRPVSTTTKNIWHVMDQAPTAFDFTKYVDGVNGVDTNDGSTLAKAFKSLDKALSWVISQTADTKALVYVVSGTYNNPLSPRRTATNHQWVFRPYNNTGRVICSNHESLTWTAVDNHYSATSTSVVYAVYDASVLTAYGDFTKLTLKTSEAEVESTAGSYYVNGTAVYVHLADGRAPDANCLPFVNYQNLKVAQNAKVWFENFDFYGGNATTTGCARIESVASNPATVAYFSNCTFKYGQYNGLALLGGEAYCENCTASSNGTDGFNYHAASGFLPYGVEINCTGRDNGTSGNSDNGSSIHDGGSIVRFNGSYSRNIGRNIQDIGTGTQSWNLGCINRDSAHTTAPINWSSGDGSSTTTMWLDHCASYGVPTDIECNANCFAYRRAFVGAGALTGTGTQANY